MMWWRSDQGREGNQVNKILGPLLAPFYTRFAVTGSGVTVLGVINQPKGEVTQSDHPGAADFSPQKGRVGDFAVYYVWYRYFTATSSLNCCYTANFSVEPVSWVSSVADFTSVNNKPHKKGDQGLLLLSNKAWNSWSRRNKKANLLAQAVQNFSHFPPNPRARSEQSVRWSEHEF